MNVVAATKDQVQSHPYDYYYQPGDALRPAPPRVAPSSGWLAAPPVFESFKPKKLSAAQQELVAIAADHFWQGDVYMDAVAADFRALGSAKARAMFEQALENGIDSVPDAPRSFVEVFTQLRNTPAWFDAELWERGRELWINCSFAGKLGMGMIDALGTVVGAEVSSSVGATGRLLSATRFYETGKFFFEATFPEFIDQNSAAFKTAVRVRLIHALARGGLRRMWGDGQFAHHGNPISATTTMGAAVTFGLLPMAVDHYYGRLKTDEEMDAVMHYWAYIGHVFGVPPELIPHTAEDGVVLASYMTTHAGGPTEGTVKIAQQLQTAVDGLPPAARWLAHAAVPAVMGLLAVYGGEQLARAAMHGTPYAARRFGLWRRLFETMVVANVRYRILLDKTPGARRRISRRAEIHDPFNARLMRGARTLATKSSGYTHHDQSTSVPVGCPLH